jgi:hypothetical protein
MRWPWQRRMPEPRTDKAPREPVTSAAVEGRVPPTGWAFLPPLQRTIGSVQLTSDPRRFAGALSSWDDPSFTGPMTHLVSAQAPPGVIDVDGGGPVPGNGGYTAASVEMTLLPPPAPRVRPTPDRYGGVPMTAQRTESDGGTLEGGSLLAAEPDAFQVLHVDALPLQALPVQASDSSPEPAVSAPASEVEASGPSRPRHTDGSISDGGATCVPLPSAPAVQRASSGPTDSSPSFRPAPHTSKLGLGMPLSFSEPAASAEPFPGTSPGPFPLPVQRASTPDSPAPPAPLPAVEDGDRDAVDAVLPDAGAGIVNEATDVEATLSPPSEDASAPLLSAIVPAAPPDPLSHGESGEAGPSRSASEVSAPSMPVVSRFGPALSGRSEVEGFGHDPDVEEGLTEQPGRAGSVAESSEHALAAYPDAGPATERLAAEPAPPPSLVVGSASISQARAAGNPPVQRNIAAGDPVQQDSANGASVEAASRAEWMEQADGPRGQGPQGSTTQGSTAAGSTRDSGQRASSQGGGESPGDNGLSTPPAALQIQRASRSAVDPPAQAIPKPVSAVVMRVVRTATAGTTPDTWQRLTAMPVMPTAAARSPFPAPAPSPATAPSFLTPAPSPGAQAVYADVSRVTAAAGTDVAGHGVHAAPTPTSIPGSVATLVGIDNGLGFDRDFGSGPDSATESGAGTGASFNAAPDAAPEPSAAVGRVIQRTISGQGAGRVDGAGPGDPAGQQRLSASPATVPGPAVSTQAHAASRPGFLANAAFPGFAASPESAASRGNRVGPGSPWSHPETPHPVVLGLAGASPERAEADEALQWEVSSTAPDYSAAAPGPPAPPTAIPEAADGGPSAQAGTEPAPAGPPQGPAAGGAAASGAAATATPEQLEDLAKRLAGPLIRRIKAEMLLDRERRGLRTDAN